MKSSPFVAFLVVLSAGVCAGCAALAPPANDEVSAIPAPTAPPKVVHIASCWAGVPLMQDMIGAYDHRSANVAYDLAGMPSDLAATMVPDGRADLAIIGKPAGVDAAGRIIALDAVAVIVHASSPITNTSSTELAALFEGYRLDWAELGGKSARPQIVVREGGATSREVFEAVILDARSISSAARLLPHDQAIVDYVAEHPAAVGLASVACIDERVRAIAIDGIEVSAETIGTGRYPLVIALHLLTADSASEQARALAAFVQNQGGRAIIQQRYALPQKP